MEDSLSRRVAVASGRELADTVIRNGNIVDVFNGEIIKEDVAIVDGYIAGIGSFEGHRIIDAKGSYISPGLIDGHVHVESSMVTPQEFAKVLLMHGVTTAISDPHEIANVSGIQGIQYMLDQSEDLPFDLFVMLPSCVPATKFEFAGAKLLMEDLLPFFHHPRVLGLAEVMNFPAVHGGEVEILKKLRKASSLGKKIDGHGAGLTANDLNVYMAAGIRTDHECTTAQEAKERLQKGMYVMIREGTVAKDLKNIIGVVNNMNSRRCLFVTDDKHLDDLLMEGSIDHNVKLAISSGIDPITAIQMATLNAAECFGLGDRGAIVPGYKADLLIVENLKEMKIKQVIKNGEEVVSDGIFKKILKPNPAKKADLSKTVVFNDICREDLTIPLAGEYANVIEVIPNSLMTRHQIVQVPANLQGHFQTSPTLDLMKIALIERHRLTGKIGLGIVKGLGLKAGAIASTVSHDSHNLIVCGENDDDILLASTQLKKMQGGLIVVKNGAILASLELPISGLMSPLSHTEVNEKLTNVNDALKKLGVTSEFNPFLTLSFLALPVIPELKLTVQGLFHVGKFHHLPVSCNQNPQNPNVQS
ncbi:adenine deaminase [Bacillus dakarensis]|uniref:adenine deaminase n=1 Tax=Robertmurraya dakarensis TaxID=1926278 RepID=UPI0009815ADE|nr:adenine deaminase [Bacillus dakarensis]